MRNHEEAVQNAEGERWHSEEVHRANGFTMVAQERRPPSCRLGIARSLSHPAQHGSLRNIEAEHLQLAVYARRAPRRVFGSHAEDEFAQLLAHAFSPGAVAMARELRPVQLESRPMPTPTVSSWTRINACFRPGQSRRKITQNNLSGAASRGWGCRSFKTASCCRRARFSKSSSRRGRKDCMGRPINSFSERSMSQL